jgi:hypothetical protein
LLLQAVEQVVVRTLVAVEQVVYALQQTKH